MAKYILTFEDDCDTGAVRVTHSRVRCGCSLDGPTPAETLAHGVVEGIRKSFGEPEEISENKELN